MKKKGSGFIAFSCFILVLLLQAVVFAPVLAVTYNYDRGNHLNSVTLDNGQTIDLNYDNNGNVTGILAPVGVPPTSIALDKHALALSSEPGTIIATVYPLNATNKSIVWTSSNPAVAIVKNGVVTPLSNGSAQIKATTVQGGFNDTCNVQVTNNSLDSYTKLLLHMDGSSNGTVITDQTGKAVDNSGNVQTRTDKTKFGSASAYFDGNSTLSLADSEDWNFGSGDFTIECWFARTGTGCARLFGQTDVNVTSSTTPIICGFDANNKIYFAVQDTQSRSVTSSTAVSDSSWHHLAACRSGAAITVFLDGKAIGAISNVGALVDSTDKFYIGSWCNASYRYKGYLDELRVSKGIARWTNNFDVPTQPYNSTNIPVTGVILNQHSLQMNVGSGTALTASVQPANASNQSVIWSSSMPSVVSVAYGVLTALSPGAATITVRTSSGGYADSCTVAAFRGADAKTRLLLHMDGSDDGNVIIDETGKAVENLGGVLTKISMPKFGSASANFNGSGSLSLADTADWDFGSSDFTIDCWFLRNTTGCQRLFGQTDSGVTSEKTSLLCGFDANNKLYLYVRDTQDHSFTSVNSVTDTSWHHLAVCRSASNVTVYLDGVSIGSIANVGTLVNSSEKFSIGSWNNTSYRFNGYIDEFRISKGVARWTADFNPPAQPYLGIPKPVTGIALDKMNLDLTAGTPATLTAALTPEDASDTRINWSSSNPSVATVNNGVVTPISPGSAVITALTVDGGYTATCTITVKGYCEASTKLLLHMDGNNNGTVFIDDCGRTVNVRGNAKTVTEDKKIGTASTYFDGAGASLSVNNDIDWAMENNNFTIETWVKVNNTSADNSTILFYGNDSDYSTGYSLYLNQGKVYFTCATNQFITGNTSSPISLNTWHHIALIRNGSLLRLYVDGQEQVSRPITSSILQPMVGNFNIGRAFGASTARYYFTGYMDELRISKGIARWTANFTPPTEPYSAVVAPITSVVLNQHTLNLTAGSDPTILIANITPSNATNKSLIWTTSNQSAAVVDSGGAVSPVLPGTAVITVKSADGEFIDKCTVSVTGTFDAVTKLLLHMDGTEGSKVFVDSSGKTVSNNGNTTISAGTKKLGTASGNFDGNSSLNVADSEDWNFNSGDFTIDCWFSRNGTGCRRLFGQTDSSITPSTTPIICGFDSNNHIYIEVRDTQSRTFTSSVAVTDSNWHHLAVCRAGSAITIYLDGQSVGTIGNVGALVNSADNFCIGSWNSTSFSFTGYIDEFRISKGVARWTGNFNLPNQPYNCIGVPVAGVTLDRSTLALNSGNNATLVATITPSNASNKSITWSSSSNNIATVSNGVVTGVSAGTATITATTVDGGFHAECTVTVTGADTFNKLLLHMDGLDNGRTFTDTCGKTVTAVGDVKTVIADKKFGTASASFDGNGDYLSLADSADWDFGSGDFTIDFWFKRNASGMGCKRLFGQTDANINPATTPIICGFDSNNNIYLEVRDTQNRSVTSSVAVNDTSWHHLAICRAAGVITLYLDGIPQGTISNTGTLVNSGDRLYIGSWNTAANPFYGNIDEVRISKGIARWTGQFVPPTAPY